eukprot:3103400-Pleurochrysis_carterae.AAC.3
MNTYSLTTIAFVGCRLTRACDRPVQSQGAHVGCRKSLSLAYNDVGVLLASEAQLDAAVEWFHKALSTAPDGTKTARAHNALDIAPRAPLPLPPLEAQPVGSLRLKLSRSTKIVYVES